MFLKVLSDKVLRDITMILSYIFLVTQEILKMLEL